MKNKLYSAIIAAAAATAFSACNSDINNFMVDDTVGFLKKGIQETTVYEGVNDPTKVNVIKAGKGFQAATVTVTVDDELLTAYNEANPSANLAILPEDCYSFETKTLELSADDYIKPFIINWDIDKLKDALAADPNLAIPLKLNIVGDEALNIAEDRTTLFVKPALDKATIGLFDKKGNSLSRTEGYIKMDTPSRANTPELVDVFFQVNTNFICQKDLKFSVEIDPQALADYNAANGTEYEMLPAEAFEYTNDWQINEYLSSTFIKFRFNRLYLIPRIGEGSSKYGDYVLPLRLTSSDFAEIDQDNSLIIYHISIEATEISREKWTITSNYNTDNEACADPKLLLDDDKQSFWESTAASKDALPYIFTINFGTERSLYKVLCDLPAGIPLTRASNKTGYVEASLDGENWEQIGEFTQTKNTQAIVIPVTPTVANYMRLVITDTFKNNGKTNLAEIRALGE